PTNLNLFRTVAIWIDRVNRQIVMRDRKYPAAIFFALHCGLVREKLFFNFTAMSGGRNVFVSDYDAVLPARVFTGMKSRAVDGIGRHVPKLLLAVQGSDLIFLEELPELVRVTPFHFIDPLD